MIYGYGRCSTNEKKQDIDRQIRDLKNAGAEKVTIEYEHGDARTKKEQQMLLAALQPGDTLIVTEVSRLARSTQQLCNIIDTIKEKQLCLIILGSITMDCRSSAPDPMTEAFLQMAGVFSQLELAMIRARVKSGMENAKAKGQRIGRPATSKEQIPDIFYRHYPAYSAGSLNLTEFARVCNLSRTTVYKYLSILHNENRITK